jgi:hypothetical protein
MKTVWLNIYETLKIRLIELEFCFENVNALKFIYHLKVQSLVI